MIRIRLLSYLCAGALATHLWAADGIGASGTGNSSSTPAEPAAKTTKISAADLDQLRKRISEQEEQIKQLQKAVAAQRDLLESTVRTVESSNAGTLGNGDAHLVNVGGVTSAPGVAPTSRAAQGGNNESSPLQLKIGDSYLTPVGFMDLTYVGRTTNVGSGIGTNFGSIPYANSAAGNLRDSYLAIQNSRIGARFDSMFGNTKVLAYWESDFLGNQPGNVLVSSNSQTLRLRLFFADVRKDKWELAGGQMWSLMTPNRVGAGSVTSDVFFTNTVDVNYHIGLTWTRNPGFRVIYHPTDKIAWAIGMENQQPYVGGSAGGSTILLPTNLSSAVAGELNSGASNFAAPGQRPDIITKLVFDPSPAYHTELVGLWGAEKTFNPANSNNYTKATGGFSFNNNLTLFKGFRLIENATYGNGIGRYFFGQGPDFVVNADASPTNIKAAGTVDGFEYQITKTTQFYAYYGAEYFGRQNVWDPTAKKFTGYGFTGSPNSQNRDLQETTVGFQQTIWRDPRFGALQFFGQYSYLFREPWYVTTTAPGKASTNMFFVNLRYALPGAVPKLQAKK